MMDYSFVSGISKLTGKENVIGTGLPSFVPGVQSGDILMTLKASASSFLCAPLSTLTSLTFPSVPTMKLRETLPVIPAFLHSSGYCN